jgi:hypothetical protein
MEINNNGFLQYSVGFQMSLMKQNGWKELVWNPFQ